MRASIVGASGYAGGELLRLLIDHPEIDVFQATSERHTGQYTYQLHPNLRSRSSLKFTSRETLEPCDVLFLALPHGESQKQIEHFAGLSQRIIDLSADFRIQDLDLYRRFYGEEHLAPNWLSQFVYGLPELNRECIREANFISGVGCNATAANLALLPIVQSDLLDLSRPIIVDIKVGSSEAGASATPGSHHPVRSNAVRTFSPTGHRHTAEIIQGLGLSDVHLTVTAIELVRGVLATAHAFVRPGVTEKDLWRVYRTFAKQELFIRLVKERRGVYRSPEPKILSGTNYGDIGFYLDAESRRIVSIAAIDNLMKGAAGSAVQSLNLMCGFEEDCGLGFGGLHPI